MFPREMRYLSVKQMILGDFGHKAKTFVCGLGHSERDEGIVGDFDEFFCGGVGVVLDFDIEDFFVVSGDGPGAGINKWLLGAFIEGGVAFDEFLEGLEGLVPVGDLFVDFDWVG